MQRLLALVARWAKRNRHERLYNLAGNLKNEILRSKSRSGKV